MTNEFRTIPSLNNLYEINSDGTVIRRVDTGRILRPRVDFYNQKTECTQYLRIGVSVNGKHLNKFVHSLVAECWLGERPEGLQVDHIDRNTFNNYYKNLRYVDIKTQRMNTGGKTAPLQIILTKDEEKISFDCVSDAARALQKYYPGKPLCSLITCFSRRYNKVLDFDVEYFKFGEKIIGRNPCSSRSPQAVILKFDGEKFYFKSYLEAAKVLAEIYPSRKVNTFLHKLSYHKAKIFDIEIEYTGN